MNITVGELLSLLTDSFVYVYVHSDDNKDMYHGVSYLCNNCSKSYVGGFDVGENEEGPYINIEVF